MTDDPTVGSATANQPAGPDNGLERWLRWLLVWALLTFGTVKLVHGYRPQFSLPEWVFYLAAASELAIAIALALGHTVLGTSATVAFFVVALVYSWLSGSSSCGCLGPLELSAGVYRMIAASLGTVAAVLLLRRLQQDDGPTAATR